MSDLELVLRALNLLAGAVVIGTLVTFQLTITPVMRAWDPAGTFRLHKALLLANPDTYVIPCWVIAQLTAIAALVAGDDSPSDSVSLTIAGIALLVLVFIVSETRNRPINSVVAEADTAPADYPDWLRRWYGAHLARTLAGAGALICFVLAALLAV